MAFSRQVLPRDLPHEDLVSSMVSIGINLGSTPSSQPANIEDVLFFASLGAIEGEDFRILSVLTTWLGVHHSIINVDRLKTLVSSNSNQKFKAYWASIGTWLNSDHRFSKIAQLYKGPKVELLSVGTDFQISRHGEDPRFSIGFLKVPANLLRDRKSDVLSPTQVAHQLRAYYNRVIIGPSYRADMWTAVEENPEISAANLARTAYGSFATAWRVKQEWLVVH